MDLHISVIADIRDIFARVAPSVEIIDWSLSGHTWVLNKKPASVEIINQYTWTGLTMDLILQFQNKYDGFLSTFDGFIVAHPNVFALLFEKYNKPVIVINSCRYDMPMCLTGGNTHMISELNACMIRLEQKQLLYFISNNLADKEYFRLANPSVKTDIIPSLCLYTGLTWNPNSAHTKFLLYSGNIPSHTLITHRNELGRFDWNILMQFKGIIHIPYEASTMSIFEHLSTGIPLFFPTKRFMSELLEGGHASIQCNYWRRFAGRAPPDYLLATDNPVFWLDRADYYDFEGVYFFDSFNELFLQLETFQDSKFEIRMKFLQDRKNTALNSWQQIITKNQH
jgi:hypothetical protein